MKRQDFIQTTTRFWAKVDRRGPDECWPWTAELNGMGYGRFAFGAGGTRQRFLAHRLVLVILGTPATDEQVVMHSCDNPRCVNPSHLSVGTQTDNMRDCLAKGRMDMHGLDLAPTRRKAS